MAKAKAKAKRAGRPVSVGGTATAIVRMPKTLSAAINGWAAAHKVGRSEAIRRLLKLGLDARG